jgi:hypothetical protein
MDPTLLATVGALLTPGSGADTARSGRRTGTWVPTQRTIDSRCKQSSDASTPEAVVDAERARLRAGAGCLPAGRTSTDKERLCPELDLRDDSPATHVRDRRTRRTKPAGFDSPPDRGPRDQRPRTMSRPAGLAGGTPACGPQDPRVQRMGRCALGLCSRAGGTRRQDECDHR